MNALVCHSLTTGMGLMFWKLHLCTKRDGLVKFRVTLETRVLNSVLCLVSVWFWVKLWDLEADRPQPGVPDPRTVPHLHCLCCYLGGWGEQWLAAGSHRSKHHLSVPRIWTWPMCQNLEVGVRSSDVSRTQLSMDKWALSLLVHGQRN